jgi:protein tyrosine/serine phosphatase
MIFDQQNPHSASLKKKFGRIPPVPHPCPGSGKFISRQVPVSFLVSIPCRQNQQGRIIGVSPAFSPVEGPSPSACETSASQSSVRSAMRSVSIVSCARHAAVLLGSFLSVGLGWAVLYLAALQMGDNFHTVIPGEFYRSAQPTAAKIAEYHQNYGLRTIINLRGENSGSGWYDAEIDGAMKLGIAHVDFRMSARRDMTMEQFDRLMDVFRKAEKPILVHCTSGADRSGLVSALYVAAIAKLGEDSAERQISFKFGHLPLPISSAYAMDRSFEALEPALGFPGS